MCIPISNAMHAIVHLRKNLSLSFGKKGQTSTITWLPEIDKS
jgi:hypothetical protein